MMFRRGVVYERLDVACGRGRPICPYRVRRWRERDPAPGTDAAAQGSSKPALQVAGVDGANGGRERDAC